MIRWALILAASVLFYVTLNGIALGFVYRVEIPFGGPTFHTQVNITSFRVQPPSLEVLRS